MTKFLILAIIIVFTLTIFINACNPKYTQEPQTIFEEYGE